MYHGITKKCVQSLSLLNLISSYIYMNHCLLCPTGKKLSLPSYIATFPLNITRGQQYMGHWVCVGIFTLEGSSVVVWGLGRDRGEPICQRGAAAVSTNLGLRPCK